MLRKRFFEEDTRTAGTRRCAVDVLAGAREDTPTYACFAGPRHIQTPEHARAHATMSRAGWRGDGNQPSSMRMHLRQIQSARCVRRSLSVRERERMTCGPVC